MKEKEEVTSKGDYGNFVEDASKDKQLREAFLEGLKQQGINAKGLLDVFYRLGYRGVSLDQCQTTLNQVKDPDRLFKCWDAKY